jgi:low affinity Fe/Cu permease
MVKAIEKKLNFLEEVSIKLTKWVGTPYSLIAHSFLFVGIFALRYFNFTTDQILLLLTTAVSLEAIYLALFIQMTVNRNTESLQDVEEDIEDIQEDVIEDEVAHKALINIGREIRALQHDLDILKKSGMLKTLGNNNPPRANA